MHFIHRERDPVRRHRVSMELDDLLSVALVKDVKLRCYLSVDYGEIVDIMSRPYVSELRYHCWVTSTSLAEYKSKNVIYHTDK